MLIHTSASYHYTLFDSYYTKYYIYYKELYCREDTENNIKNYYRKDCIFINVNIQNMNISL